MTREWFTIKELSELLSISTTAVVELKRKLKYRRVYVDKLRILDYHVSNIKLLYYEVTTSTIGMYWHDYISEEAKC